MPPGTIARTAAACRALIMAQIKIAKYSQALTPAIEFIAAAGIALAGVCSTALPCRNLLREQDDAHFRLDRAAERGLAHRAASFAEFFRLEHC